MILTVVFIRFIKIINITTVLRCQDVQTTVGRVEGTSMISLSLRSEPSRLHTTMHKARYFVTLNLG